MKTIILLCLFIMPAIYFPAQGDLIVEGRLGIGTSDPLFPLHLKKDTLSINGLEIANLGSSNLGLDGDVVPYGGSALGFDLGNNTSVEHWDDVVANDFITFSDARVKKNISSLNHGLAEVMKLRPVRFQYTNKIDIDQRVRCGFIAQEVEEIMPDLVCSEDVDVDPDTGAIIRKQAEYKTMNYLEFIPILVQAVQEQQKQISDLEKQIEDLKHTIIGS